MKKRGTAYVFAVIALAAVAAMGAKKGKGLHPGLVPLPDMPPIPADNPQTEAKVELGKLLYFDPRLSGDLSLACSDCHNPKAGWGDGSDICRGYPGTVHWRNCQTVVNSGYWAKLFWDGSSKSLEKQAKSAAQGAVAGNGEVDMMGARLAQVPEYVRRFREVFGSRRPSVPHAYQAIAAYERSINQPDTPYDRYLKGDDKALSAAEKRGLAIFTGKGNCVACHDGPLLSDEKYHHLGVPENEGFDDDALKQITWRYEQYAKGSTQEAYKKAKIDVGAYFVAKNKQLLGKFRTPMLRYLKYTAPYMHNGVFFTLREVIDFYDNGGGEDLVKAQFGRDAKSPLIKPLGLTDKDKADLEAFLLSTSGAEIIHEIPTLPPYGVMKPGGELSKAPAAGAPSTTAIAQEAP